jgi:hypothetical protein
VPSGPVLQQQTLNPLELAKVVAHQGEAFAAGEGGDVEIVQPDRRAPAFQGGADLAEIAI